jgi:ABC-type glycerol-3-phosphate transport system substrate-binding protein
MEELKGTALKLYESLSALIDTYPTGNALPPIQTLKKEYRVGQKTIQKVLNSLSDEGRIIIKKQKGIFVLNNSPEPTDSVPDSIADEPMEIYFPWTSPGKYALKLNYSTALRKPLMLEKLVKAYNHKTKLTNIELIANNDSQFTNLNNGNGDFDLIYNHSHLLQSSDKSFLDINNLAQHTPPELDLYPMAWHKQPGSDKLTGVSPWLALSMLAYNKKLLPKAGINPEDFQSWDNLFNYCLSLKQTTTSNYALIMTGYMSSFSRWGISLSTSKNTLTLDPEKLSGFANFIKEMTSSGCCPTCSECWDIYEKMTCYNIMQTYPLMESLSYMNFMSDDIGFAPFPLQENGSEIVSLPLFHIGAQSSFPEECWDFIRFTLSPEGQTIIDTCKRGLPTAKDYSPTGFSEDKVETMKEIMKNANVAYQDSQLPFKVRYIIESQLERWLTSGGSLKSLCRNITERSSRFLNSSNRSELEKCG